MDELDGGGIDKHKQLFNRVEAYSKRIRNEMREESNFYGDFTKVMLHTNNCTTPCTWRMILIRAK